jgi:hypothetical protein
MTIPRLNLNVGKARLSRNPAWPWEANYMQSFRDQAKALQDTLKNILQQFSDASPELVIDALQPTFEKAKMYCPKDTGRLVASAYLESVGFRGQPRVEMGFARGGNPYYAVVVHENLEMRHEPPTQAKFLEQAVNEDLPEIEKRIVANYTKFMNG